MTEKDEAVAYTINKLEKRVGLLEDTLRGLLEGFRKELESTEPGRQLLAAHEELLGDPGSDGCLLRGLSARLTIAAQLGPLPD